MSWRHLFAAWVLLGSTSNALAQSAEIARPAPSSCRGIDSNAGIVERAVPTSRGSSTILASGYLAGLSLREPLFDERADASLWAVGDTYKMGFARDGASYLPFLGSDAPRDVPTRFRVRALRSGARELDFEHAAAPRRDGTRVVYERGPFLETYELDLERAEQSFLVRERPGTGPLTIELEVVSELARGADAAGLRLTGERGGLRYSSAVAIDARGRRFDAPTRWAGDSIELELAAGDLASASFPLLVDPVITTFSFPDAGPGVRIGFDPDVAYEPFGRQWGVAHEREFSATDHDVFLVQFDEDAQTWFDFAVDSSNVDFRAPRIASHRAGKQFLVVAQGGNVGSRRIYAKSYTYLSSGSPYTPSPLLTVSPNGFDAFAPDVGGDGGGASPSYYCVVWERVVSASDHDVLARMVRTDGTIFGSTVFVSDTAALDVAPSISACDGPLPSSFQDWTVAWSRDTGTFSYDLYAARVHWDGSITSAPFPLDTSSANTRAPSVSSPTNAATRNVLVAYTRGNGAGADTYGFLLEGATVRAHANLSILTGAPPGDGQFYPSADSDGHSFVLVDTELFPGTSSYGLHASTLTWFAGEISAAEAHVSLGVSGQSTPLPRLACAGATGGPARRTFIAWHFLDLAPDPYLYGSLYEAGSFTSFCDPDSGGVPPCPCANPPSTAGRGCENSASTGGARLTASGAVDPDTVTLVASDMLPTALCLFTQTSATSNGGIVFGDGVRCTTGTTKRLATKAAAGGSASYPSGSDPSISMRSATLNDPILAGSVRYYFVYYRDPNPSFACAETFNATNALRIQW